MLGFSFRPTYPIAVSFFVLLVISKYLEIWSPSKLYVPTRLGDDIFFHIPFEKV